MEIKKHNFPNNNLSLKGFTLSEVLIGLTIISFIISLVTVGISKNMQSDKYKTGYRIAFNTIANLCAEAFILKQLPDKRIGNISSGNYGEFVKLLTDGLSVKGFMENNISDNEASKLSNIKTAIKYTNSDGFEDIIGKGDENQTINLTDYIWIITENNIAYQVQFGADENTNCGTKAVINSQTSFDDAKLKSCFIIAVDVNGIQKSPNIFEPQISNYNPNNEETISGDRFYIFVGNNGATAGNSSSTITGHIIEKRL